MNLRERVGTLDWPAINADLLGSGFAQTGPLLGPEECRALQALYREDQLYRSTIDMQRYNFGQGAYRYFKYPLPAEIQVLREEIYARLAASANTWAARAKYETAYPATFAEFTTLMRFHGQTRPTPLILKYKAGDYNCLHQDIAGDLFFPYQVVFGLSESGVDYTGGQLILTQQRPRMQTIPHLFTIPQGGAVIFSSNYHPQQGSRGFYRTVFRHGVGKIETGERYTLGVVFHDYRDKDALEA